MLLFLFLLLDFFAVGLTVVSNEGDVLFFAEMAVVASDESFVDVNILVGADEAVGLTVVSNKRDVVFFPDRAVVASEEGVVDVNELVGSNEDVEVLVGVVLDLFFSVVDSAIGNKLLTNYLCTIVLKT